MSSYKNKYTKSKSVHSWILSIANDPYYETNIIAKRFNYNVPYISEKPNYSEYGLSENFEEELKEEKKRIERKYNVILLAAIVLVASIFVFVMYNHGKTIGEILGGLFLLFWFGMIALALFSNWYDKIIENAINSTPLNKIYHNYKNDLDAYKYWTKINSIDYWMKLDGHQFENAVANVFRKNGYTATVSKQGGDGGIDIVISKNGIKTAVQCKAHKNTIGPEVARDLYGTMKHFGYDSGMIVSRSGFTTGVYDFVKGKNIRLLNLNQIMTLKPNGEY